MEQWKLLNPTTGRRLLCTDQPTVMLRWFQWHFLIMSFFSYLEVKPSVDSHDWQNWSQLIFARKCHISLAVPCKLNWLMCRWKCHIGNYIIDERRKLADLVIRNVPVREFIIACTRGILRFPSTPGKTWPIYNLNLIRKREIILVFYIIHQDWDGTGSSNPSTKITRTCLFYIVNIIPADALATQGAGASAAVVLTRFSRIILFSAPQFVDRQLYNLFGKSIF